jgi:hypothetical protein
MKRLVMLAAVLASAGLLVAPAQAKSGKDRKGDRTVTRVVDVLVDDAFTTFVDINQNGQPDPGDAFVGTVDVFRRGTEDKIGTASFSVYVVSLRGDGFALFNAALRLKRGDIFLKGLTSLAEPPVSFDAIVGGTRAFKGARGQAVERMIDEGPDTSTSAALIRGTLKFTTLRKKKG